MRLCVREHVCQRKIDCVNGYYARRDFAVLGTKYCQEACRRLQ
jgi:hypothetical protein